MTSNQVVKFGHFEEPGEYQVYHNALLVCVSLGHDMPLMENGVDAENEQKHACLRRCIPAEVGQNPIDYPIGTPGYGS